MARFFVDYSFHARASKTIEAESLEAAEALIEKEVDADGFDIDADEIDDIDFTVKEMHPVTRDGREMWTTYVAYGDKRGHPSALLSTPLFAVAS